MNEMEVANFIDPKKTHAVIAGMLSDTVSLEIARGLTDRDFSSGRDYTLFASILSIYDKIKVLPKKEDILDYLEKFYPGDESGAANVRATERVLESILAEKPDLSPEMWRENTKDIVLEIKQDMKLYALVLARSRGTPLSKVYDIFRNGMDPLVRDPSKRLKDISEEIDEGLEKASELVDGLGFGIAKLDESGIKLSPGTLTVLLAASNVGKSWFCSHMFCHGMFNEARVLYITLEMSKYSAMQRVASTITKKSPKTDYKQLIAEYHQARKENDFSVSSIVEYSPNSAFSSDIRSSIEAYRMSFDKVPDLVIVDGISDMHLSADKAYGELGQIAGDFCGFAKEYNCAFLTTAQANRQGYGDKAETLGAGQIGDSIKIFQRADTVLSLAPKAGTTNQVILYIAKARHGERDKSFGITQNLGTGQFCVGAEIRKVVKKVKTPAEQKQENLRNAHNNPDLLLNPPKQFKRVLDEQEGKEPEETKERASYRVRNK